MRLVLYTDPTTGNVIALTPPTPMTAEEAQQQLVPPGVVSFIADAEALPRDKDLRAWVLSPTGAVSVDEARVPVPVPQTASSGDFVAALCDLGWYDAVDAAALAAGGKAQALWRHASVFERQHPTVKAIAAAIGKSEADLDTLFRKTLDYAGR